MTKAVFMMFPVSGRPCFRQGLVLTEKLSGWPASDPLVIRAGFINALGPGKQLPQGLLIAA